MQCQLCLLNHAWNQWRKLHIQVQVSFLFVDQDNKQLLSKVNVTIEMIRKLVFKTTNVGHESVFSLPCGALICGPI